MNNRASLQLGGDNWAAKDANLLAYKTSLSEKNFLPIEFDFTRGSNLAATRVDENGLIEKGYENFVLQSNNFDLSPWGGTALLEGGQAGYDGTNNAWLVTKIGSFGSITQTVGYSDIQSFSVYLKAGDSTWVRITRGGKTVYFDLANGEAGAFNSYSAIGTPYMESVGNGWYRCIWALSPVSTNLVIYPAESDGDASGTNGSIYIQDAQLEQGLVATDYIETGATTAQAGILEDLPRIDYTGGTPSLLMEPQRSNILPHSEYLGGLNTLNIVLLYNEALSPQGLTNAVKLDDGTSNNVHRVDYNKAITSGQNYCFSAFAKAGNLNYAVMKVYDGSNKAVLFNLTNGNIESTIGTIVDSYSEDYGNGWYRLVVIYNAGSASSAIQLQTCDTPASLEGSGNAVYQGANNYIYAYGFQLEQGSYPTSYIPTYGATATRGGDSSTSDTISNITEGVLFFEGSVLENNNTIKLIEFNDGGLLNVIQLYYRDSSGTSPRVYAIAKSGGTQVYGSAYDILSGRGEITHKVAFRFADNDFALFYNGTKVHSQTSGTISTNPKNQVMYETSAGAIPFRGNVKQTLVFPEALSDADCITLTTL